jgi:hypothetical protein
MFVKPASPDIRVPDPAQQGTPGYFLPPEGREVEDTDLYWTRRLIDGDVVKAEPPAAAPAAAPQA